MTHRWSGWPGAWCLDCGRNDPLEMALADGLIDDEGRVLPGVISEADTVCPEPGSNRHNPYGKIA